MKRTSKRDLQIDRKTQAEKQNNAQGGTLVIWPAFVLWMRKRWTSACFSILHTNDKQWVSHLMESWPATKDVPPREMSESGLGSRFLTMCSITMSTVAIRPLATTVDFCSTQTQSSFRLHLSLEPAIGVASLQVGWRATATDYFKPEHSSHEMSSYLLNITMANQPFEYLKIIQLSS